MRTFFFSLTLSFIMTASAVNFVNAQDNQEQTNIESDFLTLDAPFEISEGTPAHFASWQGLGFLIFGLYLIGVSLTIFFAHRFKLVGLAAAEVLICVYFLWFILFPYLAVLLRKKRQLRATA